MQNNYFISDDHKRLDYQLIHQYLAQSYWAKDIPLSLLAKALDNSLCFGVYQKSNNHQVGFARMITDRATFAYLADVFILPSHRGQGLSKELMKTIKAHPDLQGLRRMVLVTKDAHSLYQQFGFTELNNSQGYMELWQPEVYKNPTKIA